MKKSKSFLLVTFCLILVAAFIVGCTPDDAGPAIGRQDLSIEEEILYDYYYYRESESFRSHYPIDTLSLRFRGAFSDTYVLFVDGPYGYFTAVTSETIDGLTFTYPDSQHATVYHQGSFYTLTEAYELGYLTMDDLLHLHQQYSGSLNRRSDKGEVPTVRENCTHTAPPVTQEPETAFAYSISDAQYIYANISDTQGITVFTIRSANELAGFCGADQSQLDETHNDSFFEKNSLIVINYTVKKSPFNLLVSDVTPNDDGTVQVDIDSYKIDPISFLDKTGSVVLEVNRIVDDPQVNHTVTEHTVSEDEYRALFPNDPIFPVFQPEGLRFDDLTVERERMDGFDNWYARIATSLFTDPKDVNLYDMFRNAYPQYTDFTEAELTYLKTTFLGDYIGWLDIVKIPAGEMNSMLLKYLDLNIEQVNQVGMENMVYFSETNSYYCISNDVAVQPITVHSSYYHGGYFIYYELGEPDGYPEYVMEVEHEDGYSVVLSNQKISPN